ncbi:hypothetical protein AUJ68_04310 [Candidatus Woesearchaeota archaeon CG1_02_57_44]|nr:MAG: hypothetical protein AUJ68_04310 [Candidatus Woesearchaeota archaeon CG1_02_57_44]
MEQDLLAYWLQRQGFATVRDLPLPGNRCVFLVGAKAKDAVHLECFASVTASGNIMHDSTDVRASVSAFIARRFSPQAKGAVSRFLSDAGLNRGHRRALALGQLAPSLRADTIKELERQGISVVLLEQALADVISDIDRLGHSDLRAMQLVRHVLLANPEVSADLIADLPAHTREATLLCLARQPWAARILKDDAVLTAILSSVGTKKLARSLKASGSRKAGLLIKELLGPKVPPSVERPLSEFLGEKNI